MVFGHLKTPILYVARLKSYKSLQSFEASMLYVTISFEAAVLHVAKSPQ